VDGATHLVTTTALMVLAATLICVAAPPASAQTVPFIDTEDATLSEVDVGDGAVHPIVSFDVRNGDYARGAYDDDDAGLGRVPVHVAIGGAAASTRRDPTRDPDRAVGMRAIRSSVSHGGLSMGCRQRERMPSRQVPTGWRGRPMKPA
jgi:hypothetical protein